MGAKGSSVCTLTALELLELVLGVVAAGLTLTPGSLDLGGGELTSTSRGAIVVDAAMGGASTSEGTAKARGGMEGVEGGSGNDMVMGESGFEPPNLGDRRMVKTSCFSMQGDKPESRCAACWPARALGWDTSGED